MRLRVAVLFLASTLPLCAATHYKPATEPEFVPPEFTAPALSPDGSALCFIAQHDGHSRLFKLDLKTQTTTGVFTAGDGEVEAFWWLSPTRLLIAAVGENDLWYFLQDLDGTKARRVALLDASPPEWIHRITGDDQRVIATLMDFYRNPLIASSPLDDGAGQHDRYVARVDVRRNSATRLDTLERDDSGHDWKSRGARLTTLRPSAALFQVVTSTHGELLARTSSLNGRWHVMWRARADQPWQEQRGKSDLPPFVPIAVDAADRLLVLASDQGNTSALMRLDTRTGQRTLIAQRPDRDIAQLIFHPSGNSAVVGVTFYSHEGEDALYFDPDDAAFHRKLTNSFPGFAARVVSTSADGALKVVATWNATTPRAYYLFDRTNGRLSLLGRERAPADAAHAAELVVVSFQAEDGTALRGHALVPVQRPSSGAPLLVAPLQFVGEPSITTDACRPEEMYLVRRGIAVAHFAVAGTTGFGAALRDAGRFQLAGRTPRDLDAGVHALIQTGCVDPGRIAIYGVGLGSMFTLRTAAESSLYRAVVVQLPQGPRTANAIPWMTSDNAPLEALIARAGGTAAAFALVHEFEPESFAPKLRVPVLVLYQPLDPSISASTLHTQLDRAKVPSTWINLDDSPGVLRRDELEQQELYAHIADFLTASFAPR